MNTRHSGDDVSNATGFTMPLYFKRAVDAAGLGAAPGARQVVAIRIASQRRHVLSEKCPLAVLEQLVALCFVRLMDMGHVDKPQAMLRALAMAGVCRAMSGVAHGLQQPIFALVSHVCCCLYAYICLLQLACSLVHCSS
jgi:hypothetical protein